MIPSTYPFPFVSPPFPYFQAFPAPAGVGGESPAQANTSTAANQGTPGTASGAAGGQTNNENQPAQPAGEMPRGGRNVFGGRGGAVYPHGYAAYPPSPPMYPAPVWYAGGEGGEQGPGRRGVVYMPMMPM